MGGGLCPKHVETFDLSYGGPIATRCTVSTRRSRPYERLDPCWRGRSGSEKAARATAPIDGTGELPSPEEIQTRISEAVTGVLDLDSYPIIGQQFDALPEDVHIVEIDAVNIEAGLEPSPGVAALLPEVRGAVRSLANA